MAEIRVVKAKPDVALNLSWVEFEALTASLAVAVPAEVVKYLARAATSTTITDNGQFAITVDGLFSAMEATMRAHQ